LILLFQKKKFGRKGYFGDKPRPKRKINEDFSNVSLKSKNYSMKLLFLL